LVKFCACGAALDLRVNWSLRQCRSWSQAVGRNNLESFGRVLCARCSGFWGYPRYWVKGWGLQVFVKKGLRCVCAVFIHRVPCNLQKAGILGFGACPLLGPGERVPAHPCGWERRSGSVVSLASVSSALASTVQPSEPRAVRPWLPNSLLKELDLNDSVLYRSFRGI